MQLGIQSAVMVPDLDRERILDWSRSIDRGPFSNLAAGSGTSRAIRKPAAKDPEIEALVEASLHHKLEHREALHS